MLNFSIGAYFFLLISSLVTENFGVGVVYTCFVSSKITPQALRELTAFPQTPQLGKVMFVRLAVPLPKNPIPRSQPCFLRDVRHRKSV